MAQAPAQLCVVVSADHELAGYHQRLGFAALGLVLRSLERLVRVVGEAVEVEAVVPVGAAYERESVRPQVVQDVVERYPEVLQQADFGPGTVVEGDRFVEYAEVAGLLDVCDGAEDEPERVVVESAAYVVVAALGERLVLVVAPSVGELRRCYVDYPFAGALRDLVHEAHEVLVGVPESHSAAYPALEERCAAGHVESDHALVLVPYVDHPVQPGVTAAEAEAAEQVVPVSSERRECRVHLLRRIEKVHQGVRSCLVDAAVGIEFLFLRILHVAEQEHQVPAFAGLQAYLQAMRRNGAPAVGDAAAALAFEHAAGPVEAVVQAQESLPVRVEAVYGGVHRVEGIVVAPLLVFGLMVDRGALHLHLSGGEVALEVLHVRGSVPEAPFLE